MNGRLVVCLLGLAAIGGPRPVSAQRPAYEELQVLSGVLSHIRLSYVDSVRYAELVPAAIRGMLESLDPHSRYIRRAAADRLASARAGDTGWLGLTLQRRGETTVIAAVGPDGPAERAGLRPGDRLLAIDTLTMAGAAHDDLAAALTGEPGTRVSLRISRLDSSDTQTFRLRLETYRWPSVATAITLDGGNAYVRLTDFDERAADDLRQALRQLRHEGMRALVLDLRGNPGGIVEEAVDAAALFVAGGTVIFRTVGRRSAANREYRTSGGGEHRDLPLVLLVDEATASAAEALAAALQDHDRALIAGRRSFGKALVQTGFALPGGDLLLLTIARVLSPSGRSIQRSYDHLSVEEYRSRAGAAPPSPTAFHTASGRPVQGGGGVVPDVTLDRAPRLPAAWVARVEDGTAEAIAERVAAGLDADPSIRAAWLTDSAQWNPAITPELDTAGLDPAEWTAETRALVLRRVAGRVAELRWDATSRARLLAAHDPDIRSAAALLADVQALLAAPSDAH